MDEIFADFREAQTHGTGTLLSSTILPISPASSPNRLVAFSKSSNALHIKGDIEAQVNDRQYASFRLPKGEAAAWVDLYLSYWYFVRELLNAEDPRNDGPKNEAGWTRVYEAWKEVTNVLIRGYSSFGFQVWTIPCIYVAGKYLRIFAIKADEKAQNAKGSKGATATTFNSGLQDDIAGDMTGKNDKLEDAGRVMNRLFQLCISDRNPIEESRKWAIYYVTNLLFKTYFKLNSISLSKNIIRALQASSTDLPPLSAFPTSHVVTFKYYLGVIHFLEEDYAKAEEHLTSAYLLCHKSATRNQELILTYLIPTHLLTTHTLPSPDLLAPYPALSALFSPLAVCIKRGDLHGFDLALSSGEDAFVKRRIYLTLERGRDIALRNLLRKVFLAAGWEEPKEGGGERQRRTRISVKEFGAGLRVGMGKVGKGEVVGTDEVECLIAGMVYKNLLKGYISRERGIVVLSRKGDAFPGTGV